jgi:20S proteasome subunit beta 5
MKQFIKHKKKHFFLSSLKFWHGTTTLAFLYRGGIIISVDSRASMGKYISSNNVEKIIPINSFLLGTMAGGAADCFFWERKLGIICHLYEIQNKHRISVAGASKILANILYKYKNKGLSMGAIITGWDQTGPGLFYVDSEGSRIKTKIISVGSGSTFAYGILDSSYEWNLKLIQGIELGRNAIFNSSFRDAFSGGKISTFIVRKEGWIKINYENIGYEAYKNYFFF